MDVLKLGTAVNNTTQRMNCKNTTPKPLAKTVATHCWEICSLVTTSIGPNGFIYTTTNPAYSWIGGWAWTGCPLGGGMQAFYDWVVSQVGPVNVGDRIMFDMPLNGVCSIAGHPNVNKICFIYKGRGCNSWTTWNCPSSNPGCVANVSKYNCCPNWGLIIQDPVLTPLGDKPPCKICCRNEAGDTIMPAFPPCVCPPGYWQIPCDWQEIPLGGLGGMHFKDGKRVFTAPPPKARYGIGSGPCICRTYETQPDGSSKCIKWSPPGCGDAPFSVTDGGGPDAV